MKRKFLIFVFVLQYFFSFIDCKKIKKPVPYNQTKPQAKYDNPNFIRDRYKYEIIKPHMPDVWKDRFAKPYHPAWMDYCDPYHCNDYHKVACGLNRATMKFKWFQSGCHIAMNNVCSHYRGMLKYDRVETKYCTLYVMFLRSGCPVSCGETLQPACGISSVDRHVVLFKNKCSLDAANCHTVSLNEYEEVDLQVCKYVAGILPN